MNRRNRTRGTTHDETQTSIVSIPPVENMTRMTLPAVELYTMTGTFSSSSEITKVKLRGRHSPRIHRKNKIKNKQPCKGCPSRDSLVSTMLT